jgi:NAD+ kinase
MKIVMTPNPYRDRQFQCAVQARGILQECGAEVRMCLPFDVDKEYTLPDGEPFADLKTEIKDADILICFGGDGTILHASKIATARQIPVLGVNIGTMGFIAELESSELELLRKIPAGEYTVEPRSMIDVSVSNGKQTLLRDCALNDVVVTKGAIARVIQVSLFCDDEEALSFSGDGVIVCTPTGSTAYSMSAGGPIVEPMAKNLLITPICAHSMLSKSIVIGPRRVISLKVGRIGRHNAFLSVDGGRAFRLNPDDVVTIKSSEKVTRLLRLKNTSFFEILNNKFIDRQRY